MKEVFNIIPVSKPRMTQRDKWKQRQCVIRYLQFKDDVKLLGITVPEYGYHITFVIPMPQSWSGKKKRLLNGNPHQQRPDKDNLEKALLDALFSDDSHIWDGRVTKRWGYEGKIIIEW